MSKNISEKIKELDEKIEWFYGEDFQLNQAIEKYSEAAKLADAIEKDLKDLKNKVEVIEDFTKE